MEIIIGKDAPLSGQLAIIAGNRAGVVLTGGTIQQTLVVTLTHIEMAQLIGTYLEKSPHYNVAAALMLGGTMARKLS